MKKRLSYIIILLLLLICGCTSSQISNENNIVSSIQPIFKEYQDYDYGYKVYDFNLDEFKVSDDTIISYANQLLEGVLVVHSVFQERPEYNIENFDWNIQISKSPASYQLYLQSLNHVNYLSKAFELTGNVKYLQVGAKFIESWLDYEELESNNRMLWYDHGTALRLENLIYFLLQVSEVENQKIVDKELHNRIMNSMKEHVELLQDDKFYTHNHNHGIFQDRSLIYYGYFIGGEEGKKIVELAKERLVIQKEFIFSNDMVSVENSIGYHIGTVDMFFTISKFLVAMDDPMGYLLSNDINKAHEFTLFAVKPNTGLAEIGDTNSIENNKISGLGYKYDNPRLLYATTLGLKGEKPRNNSKVFDDSGYYFFREHWEKEDFKESTWFMFKSGYSSKTHKHADDLSFMLYSQGYDVFVDPGWYNYVTGDKYRDYFISSLAHNTVVVDDKTYSYMDEDSYKCGLLDYTINEEGLDVVSGFNNKYDGVEIDRHIYNLKDNAFVIFDDIVSKENHNYRQLFHISEYMDVESFTDNELVLRFKENDTIVRVKQLLMDTELEIIRGDFKNETYGYISRKMNEVDSIPTASFNKYGNNIKYITLITVEEPNYNANIHFKNNKLTYINKGKSLEVSFSSRSRATFDDISITKLNGNTFRIKNNSNNPKGTKYAWYIITEKDGKVVDKIMWSDKDTIDYTFNLHENYLIKSYIMEDSGVRKQSIIAKIDYIKGTYVDVTKEYDNLNLKFNGMYYKNEGRYYTFVADIDYFWSTSFKWYIYKDGVYHTSITGSNVLEYTFDEPGQYTVSFYLNTINGDKQYWNFPIIKIE